MGGAVRIHFFNMRLLGAYLAKELWMSLTCSKLPMASPRKAGVKSAVKSLNCCRASPISSPEMLLTMLSRATLAHALLTV